MAEPFEIIAAPLELYAAPIDTAFPAIDEAPAVGWIKVAASGKLNYSDDGVSVTHGQEISAFTPAGATVPRKVWRTSESLTIAVDIADVTAEAYALALNKATITTVAATALVAGEKSIPLFQGDQVATFALLARGLSPYDEEMFAQYEVPIVYQGADSIEVTYNKGEPALLTLEFTALSDDTGDFGTYRTGTEPVTA
jgi:hypothetical protein